MNETPPRIEDLPPYLAFGKLDAKSISTDDEKIVALYSINDELVYRVELNSDRCDIEEMLDGNQVGWTTHRNLKDALTHHLMAFPLHRSQRFERLATRVANIRNIYVRFPSAVDTKTICFPGGHLFVLRQPVNDRNLEAWEHLKDKLIHDGDLAPCKVVGEQNGVILRLTSAGDVVADDVIIADCSAVLANLETAADVISKSGVLLSEKECRLDVMDAPQSLEHSLVVSNGDPSRGLLAFAVCPTDNISIDIEQLVDVFCESALRLLNSPR